MIEAYLLSEGLDAHKNLQSPLFLYEQINAA